MALVDIENPTAISDQRLLGLFQFWHGKLNGRRMPAAADLDPADMARWADNLMLVDVPGDILDFRIRWLGAKLDAMFGTPRAGTGVEAMTSEGERRQHHPAIPRGDRYRPARLLRDRSRTQQARRGRPAQAVAAAVRATARGWMRSWPAFYHELPRKGRAKPARRARHTP